MVNGRLVALIKNFTWEVNNYANIEMTQQTKYMLTVVLSVKHVH